MNKAERVHTGEQIHFPHLAKNERDMGHPELRLGERFERCPPLTLRQPSRLLERTKSLSSRLQSLGEERAAGATTLSSRPERSAVERPAVCFSIAGSRAGSFPEKRSPRW